MTRRGFPHSEICVSTPACGSTQLIAANHVLHRLLTPRHPPSALSSLTTSLLEGCFALLRGQDQGSLFEMYSHVSDTRDCLGLNESRTTAKNTQSLLDSRFVFYSIVNWAAVGLVRFELTTPRLSSVCSLTIR